MILAWYRTPVGVAYLLLLVAAGILAPLAGTGWALAVVIAVLAVVIPYKIYREGDLRRQQLAQAVADTSATARQVAAEERNAALRALKTSAGEWESGLAAERESRSLAIQTLADEVRSGRADSNTELGRLRSAVESLTQTTSELADGELRSVREHLAEAEARLEGLATAHTEAVELAQAAQEAAADENARMAERIKELTDRMQASVVTERQRQSLAFARRDADRVAYTGALAMITPQRSGSTWLFDILRCHPDVLMAPTADLFRALGGTGRRYPVDLSDTSDASLDIETAEGLGAAIPDYLPPPGFRDRSGQPTFAIEKLHPMALGFDAAAFADRLSAVAAELPDGVQPLYLVREPADSLRSFLSYQERSPWWHADLPGSAALDMYLRSYEMIAELIVKLPGMVVTYGQLANPIGLVTRLYRTINPDLGPEAALELAVHALEATSRDKRSQKGPFIADGRENVPSALEMALGTHAQDPEQARRAFDRCRALYRTIAETAERQHDESIALG